MPTKFRRITDYYDHIRHVVAKQNMIMASRKILLYQESPYSGDISCKRLDFPNGAKLEFYENVTIQQGEIYRIQYSFQYIKTDGYYFRYDKAPDRARMPDHAESHLHANQEEPRFITHSTDFEEIFAFIMACFHSA